MQNLSTIQIIAVSILPVLFAITVHEVSHGWLANIFGDPTARMMGRLTLNPLKHIDLVGTIIVPAILLLLGGFMFGWAKPVPVNFSNLRHPRRDMALVAVIGPITNLLMAIIWAAITKGGAYLLSQNFNWALAIVYMGQIGITINLMLMFLNLIPIPPLDGSRVVASILPPAIAYRYERIQLFGFLILLLLLAIGVLGYILIPPVVITQNWIYSIFHLSTVNQLQI